jgi:drug/metabolite transporter (DMT)-like permease
MAKGAIRGMIARILPPEYRSLVHRYLIPVALCLTYMFVGPTLIVVNNHLIHSHFNYPILISMMGVSASAALAHILVLMGYCTISEETAASVSGREYWRRVVPIGASYAFTLAMGNSAYVYLDVSIIQMLKCFTPVIILFVLAATGVEKPGRGIINSVLAITIGTLITTTHLKGNFQLFGVALVMGSSFAEALRLVLTQHLLTTCKFTVVEGQYYLSPVGAGVMLLMALFSEIPDAIRNGGLWIIFEESQLFFISCVLGVMANYLGYMVIQLVGSLTLKVLATTRSVGLVFYAVFFLHEEINTYEQYGYTVALAGFIAYTYMRAYKTAPPPDLPVSRPPQVDHELEGILKSTTSSGELEGMCGEGVEESKDKDSIKGSE